MKDESRESNYHKTTFHYHSFIANIQCTDELNINLFFGNYKNNKQIYQNSTNLYFKHLFLFQKFWTSYFKNYLCSAIIILLHLIKPFKQAKL